MDPSQLIQKALSMAIQNGCCLIGVEDTGYQQTLGFWLSHFMRELKIDGIHIVPLKPHNRTKEARIRQFIQELYRENYYIHDKATRRDFTWQASMYKIGKKDNKDDLLDAIAYSLDIRNEYWHLLHNIRNSPAALTGRIHVVPFNTPF
jgi:hypothetical protein